ncbi:glycosyltransferase family 2 protein [Pollutibacter soli]|uniref:glycosyltransferase family 2 protein n=1 Tax=Pollutibacter soli TaxID=3034157 RepID=UPI003014134D
MEPLISIVIPNYNRAHTILATIQSVQAQTYSNWEILFVDDNSDDGSQDLVNMLSREDNRMRIIKRESGMKGGNACRNSGMRASRGRYIVFLDSDDLLCHTCLDQRVNAASLHSNLDFWVFPGAVIFPDTEHKPVMWNVRSSRGISDLQRFAAFDSTWQTSGVLWTKDFLETHRLEWDPALSIWQDIDFHLQALLLKPGYEVFWESTVDYFVRGNSADSISRTKYYTEEKNRSRIYFWNKYAERLSAENIDPASLRSLMFTVLKTALHSRNKSLAKEVLFFGVDKSVITPAEYSLMNKNLLMEKLSLGIIPRFRFPDQQVNKLFKNAQSETLQRVPLDAEPEYT